VVVSVVVMSNGFVVTVIVTIKVVVWGVAVTMSDEVGCMDESVDGV